MIGLSLLNRFKSSTAGALSVRNNAPGKLPGPVPDGAAGGSKALAILALLAEYKKSGNVKYLNEATTVGHWIRANVTDSTGTGFGGYYVGYHDVPPPKPLNMGKSLEHDADIFFAFTALARFDSNHAAAWTAGANIARNFVREMYDSTNGHFNAGTIPVGSEAGTGTSRTGTIKGNDIIIKLVDFLDSDSNRLGKPRHK